MQCSCSASLQSANISQSMTVIQFEGKNDLICRMRGDKRPTGGLTEPGRQMRRIDPLAGGSGPRFLHSGRPRSL